MKTVKMVKIENLTNEFIFKNSHIFFPKIDSKFTGSRNKQMFGVAALLGSQIIGFVAATRISSGVGRIISLNVELKYRGRGIGTNLIRAIDKMAKTIKLNTLNIYFQCHSGNKCQMDKILKSNNWSKPLQLAVLATSDLNHLRNCMWHEKYPLPNGFIIKNWDRSHDIINIFDEAPLGLVETTNSNQIEANISKQLFFNSNMVGWVVADRVANHTIRYSSLYVLPSCRKHGQGLHLLSSALQSQVHSGIPYAKAAVNSNNHMVLKLINRKAQYLIRSTSTNNFSTNKGN